MDDLARRSRASSRRRCWSPASRSSRGAARQAVRSAAGAGPGSQASRRAPHRVVRAQRRAHPGGQRLALPRQARPAAVSRPPGAGKTAALLARGDGNPRDHRLSATGDARRHRIDSRRRGVDPRSSRRSKTGNGSRSSGIARRPAGPRSTPPPSSFSTISTCVPSPSFRHWRSSTLPTSWSYPMPQQRPPRPNSRSRARFSAHRHPHPLTSPHPLRETSSAMHRKPTRRSTEPVFTEPQRLHKVLAQCGYGSLRGLEELIIAGRITVNRQPAEVGQKVGPNDQIRINGELVRLRFAAAAHARAALSQAGRAKSSAAPIRKAGPRCSTSCRGWAAPSGSRWVASISTAKDCCCSPPRASSPTG